MPPVSSSFGAAPKDRSGAVNDLRADPAPVSLRTIERTIRDLWPRFDTYQMAAMLGVDERDVGPVFVKMRDGGRL